MSGPGTIGGIAFAGAQLDRADAIRNDPARLALLMDWRARLLKLDGLLPAGASTKGTFANGAGFGAGGRVGLGEAAGTFGWGGAAGTVALVDLKRGLRAGLYTQYMPSEAYPVHAEFPTAVLADLKAMTRAGKQAA